MFTSRQGVFAMRSVPQSAPLPNEQFGMTCILENTGGTVITWVTALLVCMYGHTYSKGMDQPGKVANPARGQLNREN